MPHYKYETHAHTTNVSKCARITPEELVQFYKFYGFSGICVTDHFLNGNTTVPQTLPWAERIELFCQGFEQACAEGLKTGMDVFFGWEYTYKGSDFLTYGLDKNWLLDHPDLLEYSLNDYCDLVHREGGFIVHAHPFREADYISMIRLIPRKVDAVEVMNACRLDFENQAADKYADFYSLLKLAGSDTHNDQLKRISGIQVEKRLNTVEDMIEAIKNNKFNIFVEPTRL